MNTYHVEKIYHFEYEAVVFATCYERPDDHYSQMAEDLEKLGISGNVVMDLLLANGSAYRRFFSISFDGKSFDYRNVKLLEEADTELLAFSTEFLQANANELDFGILSKEKHAHVLLGIPI